jgi:hypothetical protein
MFLNPLMLVGLGAAVLPFVLHLLSRARYKDVEWGAMMFLQGADVRNSHVARITQIVLLLLRSVVIGLLAVALARPIVRGKWAEQESEGRVTGRCCWTAPPAWDSTKMGARAFRWRRPRPARSSADFGLAIVSRSS